MNFSKMIRKISQLPFFDHRAYANYTNGPNSQIPYSIITKIPRNAPFNTGKERRWWGKQIEMNQQRMKEVVENSVPN